MYENILHYRVNWSIEKEDVKIFIEERTMFRNNEWVQPYAPREAVQPQLWYRAREG